MTQLETYITENENRFLEDLKSWLRIPSISTLPEHAGDIRAAAEYVADQLQRMDFERVHLIETQNHPLVYGEWLKAPGKPTVLVYGHYDVQPVDPVELWDSPPFEPTVRGDNLGFDWGKYVGAADRSPYGLSAHVDTNSAIVATVLLAIVVTLAVIYFIGCIITIIIDMNS